MRRFTSVAVYECRAQNAGNKVTAVYVVTTTLNSVHPQILVVNPCGRLVKRYGKNCIN